MSAFVMTLTQAGLAAIVNVHAGVIGPVQITQIGLTDAEFMVASTLEALPGEIKRMDVAGDTLGDDLIHVSALDASTDAYGYRGFALYTSTGLLFAVYGQADRIAEKTPATSSYLALDIAMASGQAGAITFGDTNFINPPATTESQGVVELATVAEAQAGIDALRALSPSSARAAVLGWLLAQDGAGSGLDADLFRGLAPSYFTDIVARLGYTPLNQATFNAVEIIARLLTVDGAGSGLDADLFRGLAPSYFTDIVARLGYTPLNQATFNAAEIIARLLTVDGSGSGLDADLFRGLAPSYFTDIIARLGYTPLNQTTFNAAEILTRLLTVDGAGSGVDGDLWRGQTPAQFLAAQFPSGSNVNGNWRKEPDGNGGFFIRQWGNGSTGYGYGAGNDGWSGTLTLPIAFTDLASVQGRAWAYDLSVTGVDSDLVVAQALTTSTYRLGSEDNVRTVHWEFFGK